MFKRSGLAFAYMLKSRFQVMYIPICVLISAIRVHHYTESPISKVRSSWDLQRRDPNTVPKTRYKQ